MRVNGGAERDEAESDRSAARAPTDHAAAPVPPLLALQGSAGNAAVVGMLGRGGRPGPASSAGGVHVQRAPSGTKRKREREPGQGTLMQFGIGAQLAAELEQAKAATPDQRHAMFLRALSAKFTDSGRWSVRDTARGKIAVRNEKTSGPHDYQNEPEVESLRWISTVVKRYLIADGQDPTEVQAAISDKGDLLIAANNRAANTYLKEKVNGGMSFIGTALRTTPVTEEQWEREKGGSRDALSKKAAAGREKRHFESLGTLHDQNQPEVAERYRKVLDAIGRDVVVADDGDSGLHAERRIRIRNGNRTPDHLAGTKRPCATCFSKLYPEKSEEDLEAPDAVRPGIFFFDKWSNVGISEYEDSVTRAPSQRANDMFNRIDRNVPRTYVTRARNGAIVRGGGSDSEPEPD